MRKENMRPNASCLSFHHSLVSSFVLLRVLVSLCVPVCLYPPLAFCDLTYLRHLIRSEGSQGRACPPSERQTGRGEVKTDSPPNLKPLPNPESNPSLSLTRRATQVSP